MRFANRGREVRQFHLAVAMATLLFGAVAHTANAQSAKTPVKVQGQKTTATKAGTETRIAWSNSFENSLPKARSTNKLMMVDFYTDWCVWCKKLDSDTYPNARVVALSNKLIPVKIDAEKGGKAAAQRYGVRAFPTILFINGDGAVEGKILGYESAEKFATEVQQIITAHNELPALQAAYASNPKDAVTTSKMAVLFAKQGREQDAVAALTAAHVADPENNTGELTKACNAIGDMYASNNQFDTAIAYYRNANRVAKNPEEKGYSLLGIGYCNIGRKDYPTAEKAFADLLAVPGCSAALRADAQNMLAQIAKSKAATPKQ